MTSNIANLLSLVPRWFEPVTASRDMQRSDHIVLWLILAVGAILRFWGLGNVGLHGDEETMAMPAMAVLDSGQPLLPSGMYYARALINVYLMSASAWIFGESEWAFRLPSAIVGSLTGLAAFFMGRRFLAPSFNLAFVAAIVFLPSMIEISQTARMYVFFVTCTLWFAACLFRWERDQQMTSLLFALLVWLLALHFHQLAIFAAPLFLFPGLSRQSWPALFKGGGAFLLGTALFFAYKNWISGKYPQDEERLTSIEAGVDQVAPDAIIADHAWLLGLGIFIVVVLVFALLRRVGGRLDWLKALPMLSIGFGLVSMALFQYHAAAILLAFGFVAWLRTPGLPRSWLIAPLLLAAVMAVAQLAFLHSTGLYPGRKLIGALIGMPSIWPVLRFLEYSPVAGALYGLAVLFAFSRFVQGQRLAMHFLFFAMAVWAPLLILGFFTWDMPPRYAQGQVGFFLLCVFAGVASVAQARRWVSEDARVSGAGVLALALVTVAIVNPLELARAVDSGYERHPDHKGAAEYIQSLGLDSDAVLVAEDILQQTYYLGRVDYSLRPMHDALGFSVVKNGRLVDQYTGAVLLTNGEELEALLTASAGKTLYVIGSGENFVGNERPYFRSLGIAEILASERLEVVYEGRDGKTLVWKLRP